MSYVEYARHAVLPRRKDLHQETITHRAHNYTVSRREQPMTPIFPNHAPKPSDLKHIGLQC